MDAPFENSTAIFLFAHQDDEFGVYQKIVDELSERRKVICVYLTNGNFGKISSAQRNIESIAVLSKLGVDRHNILFPGEDLGIPDSKLHDHVQPAFNWLNKFLVSVPGLHKIYLPAWEGGHHDHDVLHAITLRVAHRLGILEIVHQFPLYNGFACKGPLFRVFLPLSQNGKVAQSRIGIMNRCRFLGFCLSYPSQVKTWMGLLPFVALHYVFWGTQQIQPVSYLRIFEKPHQGILYYERRGFFTWIHMSRCMEKIRNLYPE